MKNATARLKFETEYLLLLYFPWEWHEYLCHFRVIWKSVGFKIINIGFEFFITEFAFRKLLFVIYFTVECFTKALQIKISVSWPWIILLLEIFVKFTSEVCFCKTVHQPISGKCSHFMPPGSTRKPKGFMVFSEGIKWEDWPEMD